MKKGAIFDQDGLMFDTEMLYRKAWIEMAAENGVTLAPEFFQTVCGSSGTEMHRIVHSFVPELDTESYIAQVFARSYQMQDEDLPEKKGLRELLEFFRKNGVKMAVASSTATPRILKNLKKNGLLSYFDEIVSGADLERGKPAPDVFLIAAEKLGLDPSECYVFEDSFNGVRAGAAAGCKTVMIPDLVPANEEIAKVYDACFESLLDAKKAIEAGTLQ